MIRLNLVAVLILAAFGWVIDGFVQAATPVAPQRGLETVDELLRIVQNKQPAKEEKKLIGRTPRVKPDFISWPEQVGETEDVRLMVKFHDQYQIRLDTTGQVMSKSGQNIDSLAVILEGLNVSLEPVFDIPEHDIESLIRRAERLSGKQQPDLAANFYVNGNRDAVDQAALILLHDPRVETALFDKRVDPRKAIALQEQNAAFQAVSQPANDAQLVAQSSYYSPINESTYDGGGQLISKESKEVDVETRAGAGSCCVFGDGLVPSPMADPFGWIGGAPAPSSRENPLVIKSCIDVANNNECDDLEGIFSKGEQCDATQLFFTHCLNLGAPFVRTGGCCIEGSVETLVYSECLAEDGLFLHDAYSRFDGSLTLGAPRLSTAINPQLLASAYGLTNFTTSQNTNYSYYYGILGVDPLAAVNTLAGLTPVEPGGASANENYNGSVGGFNTNQNLTATVVWGLIDMYLSDGLGGTGNLIGTPAYGNSGVPWGPTGSPPPKPSGGFIFGQKKTTVRGVTYDPNLFFCPTTNDACEFGVCAMDCWQGSDDGPCGPETGSGASAPRIEPLSPILSASLLPPTTNVLCSNFVYKATCDLMRGRSTFTPGLNPSGSLFQDLITRQPVFPGVGGCQTDNVVDDPEKSWFRDVYVPNDVCCIRLGSDCTYETYVPGTDDGEIMRGNCFFSNAAYPTMLINQAGDLQLQGLAGCYGGGGRKDDPSQCAVWCESQDVTSEVCTIAPICCDDTQCADDIWYPYAGWSFVCADLATQRRPIGDWDLGAILTAGSGVFLAASTITDFNQQLKFGGPYPEYNPLGLETPVLRNADGSIQDVNPALPGVQPFVIPAPNSCKISYGVQNQCFSAYYTEYQPSLGDASNDLFLFNNSLTPGCTDFECCHRICSINPAQTDYDYGLCCTVGWTEECVEKAQEICYTSQGGVVSTATPDFAPLQFHLSQKSARGPRPFSSAQYQNGMRRLAQAPTLPPSIFSPIPNLSTAPPDNWLQSIHSMQWTANPSPLASSTSWAAPSVLGQTGIPGLGDALTIGLDSNGQLVPIVGNLNDPIDPNQFLYGELPSSPISWWRSEGLSLYGDFDNQGWPQNPSFLSSHIGLYSWGTYIASFRPGRHPWGPYVNGTAGAGISIAVLDTSAWVQEYFDYTGNLVGAIHEDLTNVLMEGPVLGAEFVPMLFNPFVSQPQRGTAVLGTIAATVDGVGTDGIAPMANTMFFPTQSADVGDREFLAWVSALVRLKAGDIIAPTYPGGGVSDCILLDSPALGETGILEITENLQITVIAPVGDFGADVSTVLDVLTDNTILAAATMPSASPRRFWTSNYIGLGPNADDAVMCAMAPIVTTGGDCNLTRIAIDIPNGLNEPDGYINQEMQQRCYTNNFGNLFDGSKAATAQIAAVAACIQGLSLQWYGGHQIPENLRALLYDTKRIKGSLTNPPFQQPFPADSFGKPPGGPWAFDLVGPTEGPDGTPFVGGWIDPSAAGVELVINPFYQVEPTQTDIITAYFIRGYQLYGDITSLESRFDYEFLSALSQYTVGGVPIEVDPYVPGQPIIYGEEPYPEIETGEWTDLFIHGIEENKDFVNNAVGIAIDVSFKIEPESVLDKAHRYNALMYNFQAEAWQDFEVATATFDDFTATYNLVYKPADGVYFGNYFGQGNEFNMRFTFNTFAQFVDPDEPFEDEVEFEAEPFVIYYDLIHLREDGVVVP